jgi:hypothetical protein
LEKSESASDGRENQIQTGLSLLADARAVRITLVRKQDGTKYRHSKQSFELISKARVHIDNKEFSIGSQSAPHVSGRRSSRTFGLRQERKDL